ncbi:hypothetical protein D3C85_999340 [compost metagenome]
MRQPDAVRTATARTTHPRTAGPLPAAAASVDFPRADYPGPGQDHGRHLRRLFLCRRTESRGHRRCRAAHPARRASSGSIRCVVVRRGRQLGPERQGSPRLRAAHQLVPQRRMRPHHRSHARSPGLDLVDHPARPHRHPEPRHRQGPGHSTGQRRNPERHVGGGRWCLSGVRPRHVPLRRRCRGQARARLARSL